LTTETALEERPAESTRTLTLEIWEEDLQALRSEHARLSGEANPTPIGWDEFLEGCFIIGLDKLKQKTAEEVLALLEE
jgi:hypothetical protein